VSARVRVALIVLGAALIPAPASGAALTRTSPVARSAQDTSGQLSPTPPVKLSNGKSNSSSSSSSSSAPTVSAPLPDTGADLPTMALLGIGLLVSGIGLRMRTVDERIF
jgi:LPXTG-motif cell wall-anchored protein